jgi:hypothetical protein
MGNSQSTYDKWRLSALQATGEPIVTVSVGGSKRGQPMSQDTWTRLQRSVRNALANTVGPVSFATLGESTWHGVSERSYVASVLKPKLNTLDRLRSLLRQLADAYGQDAVALTVGSSSLITGSKP